MRHFVAGLVVSDVSEDLVTFVFKDKQSVKN
jgi:hypothetical protein